MMSEVEGRCLLCWAYMRFGVSWCATKYSLVLMGLADDGYVGFPLAAIGVCWMYRTRPPVTAA